MDNVIDFENVQIGKWQSSIPSEICINKDVFDEIFSTETWYKVFTPEQRERISQFLPPTVLETAGAPQQTIEDLLGRTLTRFDSNPLDTFYTNLEQGRYDPSVVQMRKTLHKAWKKDVSRQKRKYHAKLLQSILLSREKLLEERRSQKPTTNVKPGTKRPAARKIVDDTNSPAHVLKRLVDKRYKEEIQKINRQLGCETSSDEEEPPLKKPARAVRKTTPKKPKQKVVSVALPPPPPPPPAPSAPVTNSVLKAVLSEPALSDLNPASELSLLNHLGVTSLTGSSPLMCASSDLQAEHPVVPQFSRVLPSTSYSYASTSASLVNANASGQSQTYAGYETSSFNPRSSSSLSSLSGALGNGPINPLSSASSDLPPNSSLSSSQIPSPVVRSSPILASQLQAGSTFNQKYPDYSHQKLSFGYSTQIKVEPGTPRGKEVETSSDDEFEAIEPTIGFNTPSAPNVKQEKPAVPKFPVKNGIPQQTSTSRLPDDNIGKAKQPQFIRLTPQNIAAGSGQPGLQGVKYAVHVNKFLASNQSITHQPMSPSNNAQINQTQTVVQNKINVVKIVSQPGGNSGTLFQSVQKPVMSMNICSSAVTPGIQSTFVHSSPSTRPVRPTVMTSANSKVLPVTLSLQSMQKPIVRPTIATTLSVSGTYSAATSGSSTTVTSCINGQSTNSSVMNTSGGVCQTNILPSLMSGTSTTLSSCNSLTSSGMQMFNMMSGRSLSSIGDDLNLGLGFHGLDDAVMSEDDIANLDPSKFPRLSDMEKMDDFSVLDGNPFDSIPNLSDELDGLDLDLVDGICDFEALLSEEKQYASYFSLIRDVLCSTRDHRMTLICLEKTIKKWTGSAAAALNPWFHSVTNWNDALITALNFLAGNYQDVHPEDFVPYIEYKYKTKYYQWIGAGRDSDNNLSVLCTIWLEKADNLPPLKKIETEIPELREEDEENEDSDTAGEEAKKKNKRPQTPPPPRFITDWSVRPSTSDEKTNFQTQERQRFENPHKAFTYNLHGYESVVGPVKGVYSNQSGVTNKARGHSLLVDDRPPYVTILALVRDAVARLPNGEGTRSEICEMLRDSAFLAPEASNVTLNSVVSGALDRLHYERDPCVRYDSHKKSWVYLHRDRTQEQFERLHHNRSYTKSTKSRNNNGKKGKKSGKGPYIPGLDSKDTSMDSMLTPPSSASAGPMLSDAPGSTLTKLPSIDTMIPSKSLIGSPVVSSQPTFSDARFHQNSSSVNASVTDIKPTLTSTPKPISIGITPGYKQIFEDAPSGQMSSSVAMEQKGNTGGQQPRRLQFGEIIPGSPGVTQAIRFTPVSSPVNALSSTPSSGDSEQNSNALAQQTSVSVAGIPTTIVAKSPSFQQTPGQGQPQSLPVAVQMQQGPGGVVPVSVSVSCANTGLPGQQPAQVVSTTGAPVSSNQLLLNPTLIRLASTLKLPEGVRFAQVRLPFQQGASQAVGPGQIRPQQRIILTRAALSSQSHGQGVLLGQTASGQTVILSTTHGGLSHIQGATHIPVSVGSSASTLETSRGVATTLNQVGPGGNSGPRAITAQLLLQNQTTLPNQATTAGNTHSTVAEAVATQSMVVGSTGLLQTVNSGSVQMGTSRLPGVMASPASHHILAQVANQLQQQTSTGQTAGAHLSSPIIIRSQQGDLLIPHLPLGRGMQGIKVIPIPGSGGKQTVLARIVAPQTAPVPVPPAAPSTST